MTLLSKFLILHTATLCSLWSRKRSGEGQQEHEERFRMLAENASDLIARFDKDLRLLYANPALERYAHQPAASLLGKTLEEIGTPQPYCADLEASLRQVFETGQPRIQEVHIMKTDNPSYHFDAHLLPELAPNGSIQSVLAIGHDLSDHKRAEERIQQTLQENEILLKEVRYRVKNNLQLLSSLLKLQAEFIQDPRDLALFQDSQNRIRSMAIVHEQLYRSEDLAHSDFRACVRSLTTHLLRSYSRDSNRVWLRTEIEEVLLGVEKAIPCGLLVSELVSNALKHAFPEGREGEIVVRLSQVGPHVCALVVSDDGIGLPAEAQISRATTVGWDLVNTLVKQLGGKLEVERSHGTTFRIIFPIA